MPKTTAETAAPNEANRIVEVSGIERVTATDRSVQCIRVRIWKRLKSMMTDLL